MNKINQNPFPSTLVDIIQHEKNKASVWEKVDLELRKPEVRKAYFAWVKTHGNLVKYSDRLKDIDITARKITVRDRAKFPIIRQLATTVYILSNKVSKAISWIADFFKGFEKPEIVLKAQVDLYKDGIIKITECAEYLSNYLAARNMIPDELFKQPLKAFDGLKPIDKFTLLAFVGRGKVSAKLFQDNRTVFQDVLFDKCEDRAAGMEKKEIYTRNIALLKLLRFTQLKELLSADVKKTKELLNDQEISPLFRTFLSDKFTQEQIDDLLTM